MSKKNKELIDVPSTLVCNNTFYKEDWGNALLVQEGMGGVLVGKLLTIIESLGLPEKQEKATKDIIRNEVYDAFDNAWIIGDTDHAYLREKAFKFGQLSCGGNIPPGFPTRAVRGPEACPPTGGYPPGVDGNSGN